MKSEDELYLSNPPLVILTFEKQVDLLEITLMLCLCLPLQILSELQLGLYDNNFLGQKRIKERWENKEREKRENYKLICKDVITVKCVVVYENYTNHAYLFVINV